MDVLGIHDIGEYYDVFFLQDGRLTVHQAYPDGGLPFDYDEVRAELLARPELANFDPGAYQRAQIDLRQWVADRCKELDDMVSPEVLLDGFSYQGVRIQADPVAQQNATAFLTAVAAGVQIPFPVEWRTKANDTFLIVDLDALKAFSNKILLFVQTVFHARWQLKDALRAASTLEQAEAIYAGGVAQMRQIGDSI